MSYAGQYFGNYFGQWLGSQRLVVQVAGGDGYNYKPRKGKKDIIREVLDEIKKSVEQEKLVPESKVKKLLPVFGRERFKAIQKDIDFINQKIEAQKFYDQLSQERANLRKLIFAIENALLQEMRLFQEDEEIIYILMH